MSDLKQPGQPSHEVWVIESEDGFIVRPCLVREAAEREALSACGERVVRYVPAEPEQTEGQATGDVLDVGSAPNGECEVILRCSKGQAKRWEKLLYETVTVVRATPGAPK